MIGWPAELAGRVRVVRVQADLCERPNFRFCELVDEACHEKLPVG